MEEIRSGEATRREILAKTLDRLRPIMLHLISTEEALGTQLAEAAVIQRKSNATLDCPCPSCSSKLTMIRSRTSAKRFIGCTGYENGCRFTLPLPQFGNLSITQTNCKICGFQLVQARTKGRRPMTSCARCYSNKTRANATEFPTAAAPSAVQQATDSLVEATSLVKDQ